MNAVVIGGGPAGMSAAIGLARAGRKVSLYEQRPRWQGRVCGAFLNPEAVAHLAWLGVWERVREQAVLVRKSEVTFGAKSFFIPVGEQGRCAVGVPRKILEEILADEAKARGVAIHTGERFHAGSDFVVRATGRGRHEGQQGGWYGWNAVFNGVAQAPGEMALDFYPGGYVGTLTFSDGSTNVCGLFRRHGDTALSWERVMNRALQDSFSFRRRMSTAFRIGEWHGVGPLPFSKGYRGTISDDFLLAGDAAAVGDPFMGEGNGRALSAGPMIHRAISEAGTDDFSAVRSAYRRLWEEAYRMRFQMGRWTRVMMEYPALFSLLAKNTLRSQRLIRRATPYFHKGFLVKV